MPSADTSEDQLVNFLVVTPYFPLELLPFGLMNFGG